MLIPAATHCHLATLRPISISRRSHYKITLSLIFNLMCNIRPKQFPPWPEYVSKQRDSCRVELEFY